MFLYHLSSYFFIYAYLGWLLEVIYQGAVKKILTNRGFLNGPVCPIYGVGINVAILLFTPIADNILLLYLLGVLMTSGLELVAGYALDKLFHMRWWDYSKEKYNIGGYICLKFCFLWGIGVLVAMKIAHPIVSVVVDSIPLPLGIVINIICVILLLVDLIVTYKEVIGITKSLGEIEVLAAMLKEVSDNMSETVGSTAITTSDMMSEGKERVTEAVVSGRDKVTEAVASGRDKVTEAVVSSRDKVTEAVVSSKDKVTEVMSSGRDKVTEVVASGKEMMTGAMVNGKELVTGAVSGGKGKITDGRPNVELEDRYEKMLNQLKKQSQRMRNAFPQWRVTGNASSMEEYIENLSEKYEKRYEVFQAFKKEDEVQKRRDLVIEDADIDADYSENLKT